MLIKRCYTFAKDKGIVVAFAEYVIKNVGFLRLGILLVFQVVDEDLEREVCRGYDISFGSDYKLGGA